MTHALGFGLLSAPPGLRLVPVTMSLGTPLVSPPGDSPRLLVKILTSGFHPGPPKPEPSGVRPENPYL